MININVAVIVVMNLKRTQKASLQQEEGKVALAVPPRASNNQRTSLSPAARHRWCPKRFARCYFIFVKCKLCSTGNCCKNSQYIQIHILISFEETIDMGGAVSINPEFQKQSTLSIFDLLSDKKRTERMFEEIACYGQQGEGMRGKKDKIDLAELLLFITKEVNLEFTDAFVKNTTVIKQAFNFSMRGSKSKKEDMSLKQFKKLMPALLLFSHLWHIFETADDNVSATAALKSLFSK